MASIFDKLKKVAAGVARQLNPIDNGQTYSNPYPRPTPQQLPALRQLGGGIANVGRGMYHGFADPAQAVVKTYQQHPMYATPIIGPLRVAAGAVTGSIDQTPIGQRYNAGNTRTALKAHDLGLAAREAGRGAGTLALDTLNYATLGKGAAAEGALQSGIKPFVTRAVESGAKYAVPTSVAQTLQAGDYKNPADFLKRTATNYAGNVATGTLIAGAGQAVPKLARGGVQVAEHQASALKELAVGNPRPHRNISDAEVRAAERVRRQMNGWGNVTKPGDSQVYRQVQQKIGAEPNNHDAVDAVLGKIHTYESRKTALEGGYVKVPGKQETPAPKQVPNQLPVMGTKKVPARDKVFRSTRSIIERQGAAGQELAGKVRSARDVEELYQADVLRRLPSVLKLKGNGFKNFVDATQGLAEPVNNKVAQAVKEWQAVAPEFVQRSKSAGLDVGNLGPNYYPHFVDIEKVFKDQNSYNKAVNHIVSTGQAKTPEEAVKLLTYARDVSRNRKFGNLEMQRIVDLPEYDKTPDSLRRYVQGSTRRIAQAETFGPADEKSLKLITKAGQQGYDTEAMKNAYDVAVGARRYNPATQKASQNIRKYLSTTRLGLGAISNATQNVNTGIVTGHLRTMGAMLKQLNPQTRDFVQRTGTVADAVISDLRENTGFTGKVLSKITAPGFGKVETFNRSVAATAGRDYANTLAKRGKVDVLRKLGVTGDIGKQLTEDQQIMAARRIVEKTQFKVDPQDLPGWVDSPAGKLVAQFRSFSYSQSKFFSNQVLKPLAKGNVMPAARLLAALPLGYASYEAKRRLNGRPEENNPERLVLEAFNSVGGAGLPLDIFRGLVPLNNKSLTPERRVSMAVGTFAGPAAGTVAELVGAASNAAPKILGGVNNATQLGRFGLRQVPIIGTALQNRLLPYKSNAAPSGSTGGATGGGTASAGNTKQLLTAAFNTKEGQDFLNHTEAQKKQLAQTDPRARELYDMEQALKRSQASPLLPQGISQPSGDILNRYARLTDQGRQQLLNNQQDAEYQLALAQYEQKKLSGTLSRTDDLRAQSNLARQQIGAGYQKDIRDLYGLNKNQVYGLISTDPNGKAIADQLLKYGDALQSAGVSTNKFRTSKGAVSFKAATTKGGTSTKRFKAPANAYRKLKSVGTLARVARAATVRAKQPARKKLVAVKGPSPRKMKVLA